MELLSEALSEAFLFVGRILPVSMLNIKQNVLNACLFLYSWTGVWGMAHYRSFLSLIYH